MNLLDEFSRKYKTLLINDIKEHPAMINEFVVDADAYEYYQDFVNGNDDYFEWIWDNVEIALTQVIESDPVKCFNEYYNDPYYSEFRELADEFVLDYCSSKQIRINKITDIFKDRFAASSLKNLLIGFVRGTDDFSDEVRDLILYTKQLLFSDRLD